MSVTGTTYGTVSKGARYLQLAEGYITKLALDEDNEIIGYEFVKMGVMMDMIQQGVDPTEALKKTTGTYGRFADAATTINPRHQ